ncbi:hypothetical protein D5F01_LYC19132 [Larimichthys crocea]|uniref:Uncharacterized protein n=1 Tax=Larimichthys crocea TaxID=215358 RepID=A0A6G0HRA3_LARCR|nr:hypothetical protein D5F01_LYC19132 [Larimichthys crocea]
MAENSSSDCQPLPFSDPLYLKAAMLDPSFGSMWVIHDVLVPDSTKEEVSKMIKDLILEEAVQVTPTNRRTEEEEEAQETEPQSSLFASYQKKRQKTDPASTPHMQLTHYLDICNGQDCLNFWTLNRHTLPSLFKVVGIRDINTTSYYCSPLHSSTGTTTSLSITVDKVRK